MDSTSLSIQLGGPLPQGFCPVTEAAHGQTETAQGQWLFRGHQKDCSSPRANIPRMPTMCLGPALRMVSYLSRKFTNKETLTLKLSPGQRFARPE